MNRCGFSPTPEQRAWVEAMIAYGMPDTEICPLIQNHKSGKPIGLKTLRKHFATEIAAGAVKAKLEVSNWMVSVILGHDRSFQDDRLRAKLAILFAKTRMGWTETVTKGRQRVDHRDWKEAEQSLSEKIERFAQRCKTQQPSKG